MISIKEIEKYDSSKKLINFLKKKAEYVGKGSSRIVYRISKNRVVKVAMPGKYFDAAKAQNKQEVSITENYSGRNLFAEASWYHPDYIWVVSQYAQQNNKVSYDAIQLFMKTNKNFLKKMPKSFACDVGYTFQFGIIKNKLVMVDYGFNEKLYQKYYK